MHALRYGEDKLLNEARYEYDSLGRRTHKQVEIEGTLTTTQFLWQGLRLLQETCGGRQQLYIYEPDSYAPLARVDRTDGGKPSLYYFHTDQIGTPLEVTTSQGDLVWQARYKAWGEVERFEVQSIEQHLRFQGQYFDAETGLHYNTFRYYDPGVGRFTTQDPIGLLGGDNLYQYAVNPTGWVDPWGLTCDSTGKFNWKSVKQFGHTFSEHGAGPKNTQRLLDRARGTGNHQGQWLNNDQASQIIGNMKISEPTKIKIPAGLGQVITPNGDIIAARAAIVVPKPGGIRTAYPILE